MKKWTSPEKIIKILREAEATGQVVDTCRKCGISEATFYRWKKKYGGMDIAEAKRLKLMESENAKLKRLVAEQALLIQSMQEVLHKKGML
jgi:putative transposase